MVGLRDGAEALVEGAVCGLFTAADQASDYLSKAVSNVPGLGSYRDGVDLNNAFKDMACGDITQPLPVETSPAPFSGGQCETLYRVSGVGSYFLSFRDRREQTNFTSVVLRGPISNPEVVQDGSAVRWFISGFDRDTGFDSRVQLQAVSPSIGTASDGEFVSIDVSREDGQPDDCGDPGGGGNPGGNTTINYNNNNGDQISAPVTFNFGDPILSVNGNLSIPVNIEGSDFSLNPVYNFGDGSINFGIGTPGGGGDGCNPPTLPPADLPPPEDEGDPPEEKRPFRAVVVTATTIADNIKATEHGQTGGPPLFIPRLGTISIRVKLGDQSAWLADISIKHPQQMVTIPEGFTGNSWATQPIAGVEFSVTPIEVAAPSDD